MGFAADPSIQFAERECLKFVEHRAHKKDEESMVTARNRRKRRVDLG